MKTYEQLLREARQRLRESLPPSWSTYFVPRRAGRSMGLEIKCPACGDRPPITVKPWQRWRWLAVHQATMHSGQRVR